MPTLGSNCVMLDIPSRERAAQTVASLACAALRDDISSFGRASLALTLAPETEPILPLLFSETVDWARTSVGLVYETMRSGKSVEADTVRRLLKDSPSPRAEFLPLAEGIEAPDVEAKIADDSYLTHLPFSFALLSMGSGGQLRGWGSSAAAIRKFAGETDRAVEWHCDAAAPTDYQFALTRAALSRSRRAALMLIGDDQRQEFLYAMRRPVKQAPLRGVIEDLGPRIFVFCSS